MKLVATRLKKDQDLKHSIIEFAKEKSLQSGAVLSAVGSLSVARIRMAGAMPEKGDAREFPGPFEIVSLVGTIAGDGRVHLHISISDREGMVLGGHLKYGCIVDTTVELVIASEETLSFMRKNDKVTGFDELNVKKV